MLSKYHITTLGCQMNKNDSERIEGLLDYLGIKKTEKATKADLIIVNTCSVRQTAEDRVYGLIRNWQKIREKNPKLIIAPTSIDHATFQPIMAPAAIIMALISKEMVHFAKGNPAMLPGKLIKPGMAKGFPPSRNQAITTPITPPTPKERALPAASSPFE